MATLCLFHYFRIKEINFNFDHYEVPAIVTFFYIHRYVYIKIGEVYIINKAEKTIQAKTLRSAGFMILCGINIELV